VLLKQQRLLKLPQARMLLDTSLLRVFVKKSTLVPHLLTPTQQQTSPTSLPLFRQLCRLVRNWLRVSSNWLLPPKLRLV
jgi:hypothetical protein